MCCVHSTETFYSYGRSHIFVRKLLFTDGDPQTRGYPIYYDPKFSVLYT